MSDTDGRGHRIRFGAYEADLRSGELRRGGLKLKLQPQPFRILAILLQNPGEVVTREQLWAELWPDGTHVEFDLSLNASVKKLRRSLGDSAQFPRFIETLPRVGYRFVFPVERIPPKTEEIIAPTQANAFPHSEGLSPARRPVRWALIAAIAVLAVAASALAGLFSGPSWRALMAPGDRSEERLFSARFYVGSHVSPDGSTLAYRDSEDAHLWIVDLNTGERRELIADWVGGITAWSRDSRRIAFMKLGDPPIRLEVVDVETGSRTPVPISPKLRPTSWDWTDDGRILCTIRPEEARDKRVLAFLSPADGLVTPIREVPPRTSSFKLSPDQRFVAFTEQSPGSETRPAIQGDIRLVPVQGDGPMVTVSDHPDTENHPLWSLDGRRLLFWRDALSPNGALWSVDIDPASGEPEHGPAKIADVGELTLALGPSVGPNGEIFVSKRSPGDNSIHLLEVDPDSGVPLGEPTSRFAGGSPSWSEDGKWLRYRAHAVSGSRDLATMNFVEHNIETGEERIAPQRKSKVSPPPWHYSESRDGDFAVFADRNGRIIYREFFQTKIREELVQTAEPITGLLAFKDGREIFFSTHSQGRDIHPIKALRLSDRRVRDIGISRVPPQWAVSPNDDEVALGDLNCLVILPRNGGKARELACASPPRLPTPGHYPGVRVNYVWWTDLMPSWSPNGSKIAWTVGVEEKRLVELWIIDRLTGEHRVAWSGTEDFYTMPRQPTWSPAGGHIAFDIHRYSDNELWALRGLL